MLIISKPVEFGPDGFAVRDQCRPDSPGWRLRWFEKGGEPETIWRGSFKTCRHLQGNASTLEEARTLVGELLKAGGSGSADHIATQPTDAYPPSPEEVLPQGGHAGGRRRKKKKKRLS